jgi:hypothetical protein
MGVPVVQVSASGQEADGDAEGHGLRLVFSIVLLAFLLFLDRSELLSMSVSGFFDENALRVGYLPTIFTFDLFRELSHQVVEVRKVLTFPISFDEQSLLLVWWCFLRPFAFAPEIMLLDSDLISKVPEL